MQINKSVYFVLAEVLRTGCSKQILQRGEINIIYSLLNFSQLDCFNIVLIIILSNLRKVWLRSTDIVSSPLSCMLQSSEVICYHLCTKLTENILYIIFYSPSPLKSICIYSNFSGTFFIPPLVVCQQRACTHGPDSTMSDPTFSKFFSVKSLHSADSSTCFPRKFSNSNSEAC